MTYSDIAAGEYRARAWNVWNAGELDERSRHFYGSAREPAHDRFLEILGPADGRSLLDVGCGLGYLLERAQRAGWEVAGCDTSASWVRLANNRLGGGRVRLAQPQDLESSEKFDVICAWDVLEHLFEPLVALRAMAARLTPGGTIFVRTPNLSYLLPLYAVRRRVGHSSAVLGPTNHVVYFTARTIRTAMARSGLRVEGFPVLPPPLVEVSEWEGTSRGQWSVVAKRGWSRVAGTVAHATRGRIALTSDLDVFAARQ